MIRAQLVERDLGQDEADALAPCRGQRASVKPIPHLVFQQAAGNERLVPEFAGGPTIFHKQLSENHRAVEVDHRSSRSCSSSFIISSKDATGWRGGNAAAPWRVASFTRPSRASLTRNSFSPSGCISRGGRSSATTRLRSVTWTVSPEAARRTCSLSLFFRTLRPTVRMTIK